MGRLIQCLKVEAAGLKQRQMSTARPCAGGGQGCPDRLLHSGTCGPSPCPASLQPGRRGELCLSSQKGRPCHPAAFANLVSAVTTTTCGDNKSPVTPRNGGGGAPVWLRKPLAGQELLKITCTQIAFNLEIRQEPHPSNYLYYLKTLTSGLG